MSGLTCFCHMIWPAWMQSHGSGREWGQKWKAAFFQGSLDIQLGEADFETWLNKSRGWQNPDLSGKGSSLDPMSADCASDQFLLTCTGSALWGPDACPAGRISVSSQELSGVLLSVFLNHWHLINVFTKCWWHFWDKFRGDKCLSGFLQWSLAFQMGKATRTLAQGGDHV